MIRTSKQLEKALREANDGMVLHVEKFEDKYRVVCGNNQEWDYTLKGLVSMMSRKRVTLNNVLGYNTPIVINGLVK